MIRLARPFGFFLTEGRLVHEHVRPSCSIHRSSARLRVTGVDHGPPRTGHAHQFGSRDESAPHFHVLAPMEPPEKRPVRNSQFARLVYVEASQPVLFDENPTHRGSPVVDVERVHTVPVAVKALSLRTLGNLDQKSAPVGTEGHDRVQHLRGAARSVQRERVGPTLKRHRAQEARDAQEMVRVRMRDEDGLKSKARLIPHHLPLDTFAAVEEKEVTLPLDRQSTHVAGHGRSSCSRTQEREADHSRPATTRSGIEFGRGALAEGGRIDRRRPHR